MKVLYTITANLQIHIGPPLPGTARSAFPNEKTFKQCPPDHLNTFSNGVLPYRPRPRGGRLARFPGRRPPMKPVAVLAPIDSHIFEAELPRCEGDHTLFPRSIAFKIDATLALVQIGCWAERCQPYVGFTSSRR